MRWLIFARAALVLLAGTVLVVLPGCFQSRIEFVIEADGSGTVTLENTADMSVVAKLIGAYQAAMGAGMGSGGETEVPLREEFDQLMKVDGVRKVLEGKKGVELLSAVRTDDAEKHNQTIKLQVKFATLEDFYRCGLERLTEVKLVRAEGDLVTLRHALERPGTGVAGKRGREMRAQAAFVERMLKPYIETFQVDLVIRTPAPVLETNGTQDATGCQVAWKVTAASLVDQAALIHTLSFRSAAAGFRPFHVRSDLKGKTSDVVADPPRAPPGAPGEPTGVPESPPAPEVPAPAPPAVPPETSPPSVPK